jgi:phenylacetate-coenzyme A ligase PaaK-like adenylate-forming protein
VFSVQQPLPDLVAQLNAFRPAVLTGYPSALEALASEQAAGRLRLRPVVVELSGESADEDGRARIAGLGGALHDAYAASECLVMAFDCAEGWLHVNSDWVVLEPVEADWSPTPPGRASHTVLLTNLANRVQPVIRYDLGDSVTARAGPCPCGSPFPAIRVEGRRDDVLRLVSSDGRTVRIPPLAIALAVGSAPGVRRAQLVQTGPRTLLVRLDVSPDAPPDDVWSNAFSGLARYLSGQAVTDVGLVRATEPPTLSATSGKFRHVIAWPGSARA